jgi:hypothetical protein
LRLKLDRWQRLRWWHWVWPELRQGLLTQGWLKQDWLTIGEPVARKLTARSQIAALIACKPVRKIERLRGYNPHRRTRAGLEHRRRLGCFARSVERAEQDASACCQNDEEGIEAHVPAAAGRNDRTHISGLVVIAKIGRRAGSAAHHSPPFC